MFSRCKKPECEKPFDYKKGRVFRFRQSASEKQSSKNSHGVRHFWLCEECTQDYILEYVEGEVLLLSRPLKEKAPTEISPKKKTAAKSHSSRLVTTRHH